MPIIGGDWIESISNPYPILGDARSESNRRKKRKQMDLQFVFNIVQIVISVILVTIILMQVRGQGSGLFGAAEGSFRTRRGLEKALFQFTIAMVVVFIVVSIFTVRVSDFIQ